jgi:hypothetical protein
MNQPSETPQQRRERYLRLAEEAEAFAKRVTVETVRDHYLRLAQGWRDMAAEIERDK